MDSESENHSLQVLNSLLNRYSEPEKITQVLNIASRIINFDKHMQEITHEKNRKILFYGKTEKNFCAKFRFDKAAPPRMHLILPKLPINLSLLKPSSKRAKIEILVITDNWSDVKNLEHIVSRDDPRKGRRGHTSSKSFGRDYEKYINQYMPDMPRAYNNEVEMLVDLACAFWKERQI